MANWKKVIVSGSNAELAQLSLSNLSTQGSEDTVLTINPSGVVGTRENAASSGTSGSSGSSGAATINNEANDRVTTSTGTPGELNAEENLTFASAGGSDGNGLLTVTGDVIITHDLTVDGTASFRNTENLLVKDRFVLLASGSTTVGDGGIVVQQTTQDKGELFAYDAGTTRWAVTSSFDAGDGSAAFTPDAFMAAVVVGGSGADQTGTIASQYVKKGNIFVSSSQDIFIYS